MLIKIIALFLVVMAALAIFGRMRFPRIGGGQPKGKLPKPAICIRCGTPIPGAGPCACGAPRPPRA